jgi:hypothetical protein
MLYFESFTVVAQVSLRIPGDITTFGGISRVSSALSMVESMRLTSTFPPPKFELLKRRGYQLTTFQVRSPAETSILADPAWIAVFLAGLTLGLTALQTLGSYSAIKNGAKEASADLAKVREAAKQQAKDVLSGVTGLTQQQKQDLTVGILLFLDQFSNAPDEFSRLVVRASHFASVLRRGRTLPSVDVKSGDGDA